MSGLRGNQASLALAKQSAKGTPNTTYTDRVPFTGGSIAPVRSVSNLSETDSSRDAGVSFVENYGVEGAPEFYARTGNIHRFIHAAFGATVDAGAGPFTHTATPAAALPYYTLYREIGGTLFEQFDDCMASEITLSAEAGQPLTCSVSWLGLKATRLASQPAAVTSLTLGAGSVPNFGNCAVTIAGGATSLVSSFELTMSNNTTQQQTDEFSFYDNVPGQRELTLGFTMIFETLDEYNRFHYGGIAGTAQSATLATLAATFVFTVGADIINVAFPANGIAYEEFAADPDPSGAPVTVDVRGRAQRGASPICTIITTNTIATT